MHGCLLWGGGRGRRPRNRAPAAARASCEDSIGCMHGSSEPDLRNWKSPIPQFTQGARPDEHP
ncbi:hypothetical protein C4C65_17745 [Bordetella pertussis]|nr:hypothetical protein C3D84_17755 [Bordetella pertussis]QBU90947.1 hypothetical protein C4C65_17745 [Bordetella pertussis]QKC08735.1 hypothetical protein FG003_18920 [Bordetella pertussis]